MTNAKKPHSRNQINRAGAALISPASSGAEKKAALNLINQWRSSYSYPLNTFNSTLRSRVKKLTSNALVAQRLKRIPSIQKKLEMNAGMQLGRMQDVGGLRAVVENIEKVRDLEKIYRSKRLTHELNGEDDYISAPKESGYRSLHLIFKYKNIKNSTYDGYLLELQIRTKLQHAWATAIETMGLFLDQALKSSEGELEWLEYFKYVSAAFALMENSPVAKSLHKLTEKQILSRCIRLEKRLGVKDKLQGFTVAANAINSGKTRGSYHLISLNTKDKNVQVHSFSEKNISEANEAYAQAEMATASNRHLQVVLVKTNSAESLKKAYPNYFLDTKEFVKQIKKIESKHQLIKFSEKVNKPLKSLIKP